MPTTKVKPARLSQPIVSIEPQLTPTITRRSLASISAIAEKASNMLMEVRESMLAPHPRKRAPVYTTAQVAALCRIDKTRVTYLTTKGELPLGTALGSGKHKEFTLVEARQYVAAEGPFTPRPPNVKGKTIAIGNFKGGVSKTTTAMTLAQGLTLFGRRVLLIDLDPQASLSALNGVLADSEVDEGETVLPLIYGEQTDLRYAIQKTYWDGIDLIPASAALFSAEFYLPFKQSKDKSFRFWNILNQGIAPLLDEYDVVIIDTPPALSYLTINAFMAADGLVVPTPPSALDYASSTQFWSLFSDLSNSMQEIVPELDKSFDFISVLLAKVDQSQAATPIVRDWIQKTYEGMVLPVEIPTTTVTQSASAEFGTVYDISRYEGGLRTYQRAREAYDRFAELIDQQLVALWTAPNKD